MVSSAQRHLARLLGTPPDSAVPELVAQVRRDAGLVVQGLVDEALASDDVTSAEGALAFISERLAEMAPLLPDELRTAIARQAAGEVRRRAPDAP